MPGFEEEAFERARRIAHSRPGGSLTHSEPAKQTPPKPAPRSEPKREEKPVQVPAKPQKQTEKFPELLFKNKDNSLIMLLLLLLMDEKTDPSLLFSLLYLLM